MPCLLKIALLVILLLSVPRTQVACQLPRTAASANSISNRDLTLLSYHGPVEVGAEALQVQVLLHVLVKAKRQTDGSFAVRTVSYAERPEIKGEQPAYASAARQY